MDTYVKLGNNMETCISKWSWFREPVFSLESFAWYPSYTRKVTLDEIQLCPQSNCTHCTEPVPLTDSVSHALLSYSQNSEVSECLTSCLHQYWSCRWCGWWRRHSGGSGPRIFIWMSHSLNQTLFVTKCVQSRSPNRFLWSKIGGFSSLKQLEAVKPPNLAWEKPVGAPRLYTFCNKQCLVLWMGHPYKYPWYPHKKSTFINN